jgi:hypothetical protein
MEQLQNYADDRQFNCCVYCGSGSDTRDHVPSRILLDDPFPENLPVVPACRKCNESFSIDEEYVACLVDCVLSGGPANSTRPNVRRILECRSLLAAKIAESRSVSTVGTSFAIESDRVQSVVLKLARGHTAYELSEQLLCVPLVVSISPLSLWETKRRHEFETPPDNSIWPEVGTRAIQRAATKWPRNSGWIVVQPGRYRYLISSQSGVLVRIVLSEYLGCEVLWQ